MANSGAEKLIAVALASGIMLKAISSSVCEANCDRLRSSMRARPRVCDRPRVPRVGRMKADNMISETSERG